MGGGGGGGIDWVRGGWCGDGSGGGIGGVRRERDYGGAIRGGRGRRVESGLRGGEC